MKQIKTILKLCGFVVCFLLVKRFCESKTDGFALYKIRSDFAFCPEWEAKDLGSKEVLKQLDQPFYYLAKGAQSYVFESQDKEIVIKFFRVYHLRPPAWMSALALPFPLQPLKVRKMLAKREELFKDFSSYKIAYDEMREETGLLFLHLNKTNTLNKKVTLYDKLGIAHEVSLDEMEFLVQRKAMLVFPAIERLMQTEGIEAAKEAISALVHLLAYRCEKGIFDKDPDLNTNFGYLGKTPVQIDVGRFRLQATEKGGAYRDEIFRITDNFRQWLDRKYPPLSIHLLSEIEKLPCER